MAQVTDYDVANAAGNVVRQDLNDILDAIKTLNSGVQANLGTTSPYQLFADSTNNKLKIRSGSGDNAAATATFFEIGDLESPNLGLLKKSGGTMTGVLELDDNNSAATPALSFDGDEDTGLFRNAANIMGFSSGGTEQMVFDANGITLRQQNEIRFGDNDSSHYIGLRAAVTIASSFTLNLPTADGSNGQFLTTDGSGNLSFATAPVTTLANLSASNLTSGTIPTARFPSTLPAVSGASLTGITGSAKAFVNINGIGTLTVRDSFGISSVTDLGQGRYQPNFSSGVVSGSDYSVTHSISQDQAGHGSHGCLYVMTKSSSNFATRICKDEGSGLTIDKEFCDFAVFQN